MRLCQSQLHDCYHQAAKVMGALEYLRGTGYGIISQPCRAQRPSATGLLGMMRQHKRVVRSDAEKARASNPRGFALESDSSGAVLLLSPGGSDGFVAMVPQVTGGFPIKVMDKPIGIVVEKWDFFPILY